jgi:hypothetical protein
MSKILPFAAARSIPNATISWWHSNLEIGRDDLDKNFQIFGHGPTSDLVITPLVSSYYRSALTMD